MSFNYSFGGVANQSGGHVTINNNGSGKGSVANHTGGSYTIIENGKTTTVIKPSLATSSSDESKTSQGLTVNWAPGGIEEVTKGVVVINN